MKSTEKFRHGGVQPIACFVLKWYTAHMKMISWNVNGLRACVAKGSFTEFVNAELPDILAVQETKLQSGQIELELPDYLDYWNYAEKKGYSGTAVFCRREPLSVSFGIGIEDHDREGRVITLEYPSFYFVCVYVPNSQNELKRLEYRMHWEDDFRSYLKNLDSKKPVIMCGDLNVAHEEIDLANPKTNHFNAGFTDEERGKFTELLSAGFTDSFRLLYPDAVNRYSWWSFRMAARSRNVGWRIDYFVVSSRLADKVSDSMIYDSVQGSDHCPVGIILEES